MAKLGVSIDHIAALHKKRKFPVPDACETALIAQKHGAGAIVINLTDSHKNIQDKDLFNIRKKIRIPMLMKIPVGADLVRRMMKLKPEYVCFVPKARNEKSESGGLRLSAQANKLKNAVKSLKKKGIKVSVFIDPNAHVIREATRLGVNAVEVSTRPYTRATRQREREEYLEDLFVSGILVKEFRMEFHAGMGLTYDNVEKVASISNLKYINIGASIAAKSMRAGMGKAVEEMSRLVKKY
ncbi:pyridoxine 5'-phosphate synthase [Elusimicrobiota bacterium]